MVGSWLNACCSAGAGKEERLGVNGDGAEEDALKGPVDFICPWSVVSNLVIAKPLGTLVGPLAFLLLDDGPGGALGEV